MITFSRTSACSPVHIGGRYPLRNAAFFFSCGGFSLERGATEFRDENVAVKMAFLANSKHHILLCDSSKFDQLFFYGSIRLEDIDYVITDKCPKQAYVEMLGDKLLC